MTEEEVKKGQQLLEYIKELKNQRKRWENAKRVFRLELGTHKEYCREESSYSVDSRYINFDDLKLLTLARLNKRIEELQEEFDNL